MKLYSNNPGCQEVSSLPTSTETLPVYLPRLPGRYRCPSTTSTRTPPYRLPGRHRTVHHVHQDTTATVYCRLPRAKRYRISIGQSQHQQRGQRNHQLQQAYASMVSSMLQAYPWQWWVSLTSRQPMPLEVIRGRFFWWLKILRKAMRHHVQVVWFIERQHRGALHVHAIIYGVRTDKPFWKGMINTWEKCATKDRDEKFGDATIRPYNQQFAGRLSNYLAKERSKDLNKLEGSGSLFDIMGYSRGVKTFLSIPGKFRSLIWTSGESTSALT